MPSDYECATCKLGFSVGTYHYHRNDEGFFGSTLMVCRECGLQHRVEIPSGHEKETFYLESMPSLLIQVPRLADTMMMLPDDDWGNRQPVESRTGAELKCSGCSAHGTLVDVIEPGECCPNCGDVLPRSLADWMT